MINIGLIAPPLARHAIMPARSQLSSFRHETKRREHASTLPTNIRSRVTRCVPSPPAGEGQGGGCHLLRCVNNRERHSLQILQNIVVREPQYAIASRRKPSITFFVMTNAILEIMTLTIDFDHELAGMGNEICDVVTHRALPPEAQASQTMGLQMTPE